MKDDNIYFYDVCFEIKITKGVNYNSILLLDKQRFFWILYDSSFSYKLIFSLLPSSLKLNGYIMVFSLIKSVCLISIILSIVGLVLIVVIFDFTSFINFDALSVEVVKIEELYLLPL